MADVLIVVAKAVVVILIALFTMGNGVFFERKVSAVIQDRIGANRAAVFGFTGFGLVNTLMADPLKFLTKEDILPVRADRLLHAFGEGPHRVLARHVGGLGHAAHAERFDLLHDGREPFRVDVGDDERRPLPREGERGRPADTGGGTRHHHHLAIESPKGHVSRSFVVARRGRLG